MPMTRSTAMRALVGALAILFALATAAGAAEPHTYGLTVTAVDGGARTVTGAVTCAASSLNGRSRSYRLDPGVNVADLAVGREVGVRLAPSAGTAGDTVVEVVPPPRCQDGAPARRSGARHAKAVAPPHFFTRPFRLVLMLDRPRATTLRGMIPRDPGLPRSFERYISAALLGRKPFVSVDFTRANCDEHGAVSACPRWVPRVSIRDGFQAIVVGRFERIKGAPGFRVRASRITVHTMQRR
jgi:hypothetical protein